MKCCGEERTTPFCPMCGKGIGTPITGLLAHIRTQIKGLEGRAETYDERAKLTQDDYTRSVKLGRRDSARKAAAKWQTWAEALEALMAKGGG